MLGEHSMKHMKESRERPLTDPEETFLSSVGSALGEFYGVYSCILYNVNNQYHILHALVSN